MTHAKTIKHLIEQLRYTSSSDSRSTLQRTCLRAFHEGAGNNPTHYETGPRVLINWRQTMFQTRFRKVAVAAVILLTLFTLSYGTVRAYRYFASFSKEMPDGSVISMGSMTNASEEQMEEFKQLYRAGKAKEVEPGVWEVTLSNGELFRIGKIDPEQLFLSEQELQSRMESQADEIYELKQAGQYEKIRKPELDQIINGVQYRGYIMRFTLSDGRTVDVGAAEPEETPEP